MDTSDRIDAACSRLIAYGGGQYDCLSIVRTDTDHHLCAFNRLGSFTAFKRFDFGHDCWTQINVWDRIAREESTRSILDEICTILCLPLRSPLPTVTLELDEEQRELIAGELRNFMGELTRKILADR